MLWVLLIVYILNFLDRQIVNILAEPIARDLKLSDSDIGLMTGLAFALFYTFLGLPIARYADRPSTNRVGLISVSLAIWSGMTVLCGMAQNFVQLLLARIGVGVGENYTSYLGTLGAGSGLRVGQNGASTSIGVNLSLPIFQGGRPAAQIRQAQALRSQAIENATAAERQVIAQTRSAYAMWRSAQEVIKSSETAVSANRLSLEGVRAENSVGNRTILDILNAEQELLNSQVTLVTARRDAYVAGFALLAAMGRAEARDLGLDGGPLYNPADNYDAVRNRISDFATGPAPAPIAPTTAKVPAQSATVTRPLDPELDTAVDRSAPLTTGEHTPNR